jgi:hypothetical protein
MMKGHPYKTDELDEVRARQRRFLRTIPQGYIRKLAASTTRDLVHLPQDEGYLEHLLRRAADDLITQVPEDARRADQLEQDSLTFAQFINDNGVTLNRLSSYVAELRKDAADAQVPRNQTDFAQLIETVGYLLIWADRLAGDYVDAQVAEFTPVVVPVAPFAL